MSDMDKFEGLLRRAALLGAEVRLVPMVNAYYGDVEFYAHIKDHDSETVDVSLCRNTGLRFLPLERAAEGLTGEAARPISDAAANYSPPMLSIPDQNE